MSDGDASTVEYLSICKDLESRYGSSLFFYPSAT